jgi:hypothetical protein
MAELFFFGWGKEGERQRALQGSEQGGAEAAEIHREEAGQSTVPSQLRINKGDGATMASDAVEMTSKERVMGVVFFRMRTEGEG